MNSVVPSITQISLKKKLKFVNITMRYSLVKMQHNQSLSTLQYKIVLDQLFVVILPYNCFAVPNKISIMKRKNLIK